MNKELLYSALFSTFLHSFIIGLLLHSNNPNYHFFIPGRAHNISIYFIKNRAHRESHKTVRLKTQNIYSSKTSLAMNLKYHHLSALKNNHFTSHKRNHNKKIAGTTLNPLVTLIYHTIEQHIVYPTSAKRLGHHGQVIISFLLEPSGYIHSAQITQTSHYTDLDHAALRTIERAQPIAHVSKYLKSVQQITIPIIYR